MAAANSEGDISATPFNASECVARPAARSSTCAVTRAAFAAKAARAAEAAAGDA